MEDEIIVLNGAKVLKKIVIPNFRTNIGHYDYPKLEFMANISDGHLLVGGWNFLQILRLRDDTFSNSFAHDVNTFPRDAIKVRNKIYAILMHSRDDRPKEVVIVHIKNNKIVVV